jgi:hypothetical protein
VKRDRAAKAVKAAVPTIMERSETFFGGRTAHWRERCWAFAAASAILTSRT